MNPNRFVVTREQRRQLERDNAKQPAVMTPVPAEEWPPLPERKTMPVSVWRSRFFLAQQFVAADGFRLSINRTTLDPATGRWHDHISWDDLMLVKRECGYGDRWAYECFPPDDRVVNVANLRHLWFPFVEPSFGWR